MNKIWFLIVGITVVTSCAPSYQKHNRKRYRIEMKRKEKVLTESQVKVNYTKTMAVNNQAEDVRIMSSWSEEEKRMFAKKYFYKEIFFRNDSLIIIK